ncbi:hypothetical protein DL764_005658 [Monosporascus ibericus]|uniref:AMP-dependent synthetase/ligase domain-containing protein n=1 Tax=Monosporascus ibericus TaxID=155417 RepID=A0A4Q4T8J3_9PEZI|nr:hypothetical protein DL764_005658 [Monosporascus ibericus]
MASSLTLPKLPVFDAIAGHDPQSTAVVHCLTGRTFRYGGLLPDVCRVRDRIYAAARKSDIRGERVAFLVENSYDYVVTFLAILAARAIALPLSPPFPAPELQYILSQSGASLLLHTPRYAEKTKEVLSTPSPPPSPRQKPELKPPPTVLELPKHLGADPGSSYETVSLSDDAGDAEGAGLMLYTSGTTDRPKGVLLPESAVTAQCRSLIEAWKYTTADRLLHVLPLHHIHGTINALLTPLFAGSSIEFLFPFNADSVWRRLATPFLDSPHANGVNGTRGSANGTDIKHRTNGLLHHHAAPEQPESRVTADMPREKITFFTAVPTVYARLLSSHAQLQQSSPALAEAARTAVSPAHMRVSISGSAALPTPLGRAWRELSRGTVLLERYGMTEVGMALSCGLDPADRIDGSVGWPLPGVEARLVDLDTGEVIPEDTEADGDGAGGRERAGEIQLRGPTVFREYWNNPSATAREFVAADPSDSNQGRWFRTGDVAVRRRAPAGAGAGTGRSGPWASGGTVWFVLGRQSADIIKTGGEKVSALEVERELLSLPEVAEAAVLAVPSGKWGQKVGAVVVLSASQRDRGWRPMDMRRALRGRLASYKVPQVLRVVDRIERNAMGKINKKELVRKVFVDDFSGDEM